MSAEINWKAACQQETDNTQAELLTEYQNNSEELFRQVSKGLITHFEYIEKKQGLQDRIAYELGKNILINFETQSR